MSRYLRNLLIAGLVAIVSVAACNKETTQPQQDPLVGTWALSDMEQTTVLKTATDNSQTLGIPMGYTLADTTITWNMFQLLGVSLTVDLKEDNTFSMTGKLPVTSDTLGQMPSVVQLTDQGSWSAAEDMSTFTMQGNLYTIAGDLTVNNQDNPTMIGLSYSEETQDTLLYPADLTQDGIPDTVVSLIVQDSTATSLGFTKQ